MLSRYFFHCEDKKREREANIKAMITTDIMTFTAAHKVLRAETRLH